MKRIIVLVLVVTFLASFPLSDNIVDAYYYFKLQLVKKIFIIPESFNEAPMADPDLPRISFNSRILPVEKRCETYRYRFSSHEGGFDSKLYLRYHSKDAVLEITGVSGKRLTIYSQELPDKRFFKVIDLDERSS